MDIRYVMSSMKSLMQDLVQESIISNEFVNNLDKFIVKAKELSTKLKLQKLNVVAEETRLRQRRRPSTVSSSSDDVIFVPTEIVTVDLDSDSEPLVKSNGIDSKSSTSLTEIRK